MSSGIVYAADYDCATVGAEFADFTQRLSTILEQPDVKIVCHKFTHEALVFCHELQKRDISLPIIMDAIAAGECTIELTRNALAPSEDCPLCTTRYPTHQPLKLTTQARMHL